MKTTLATKLHTTTWVVAIILTLVPLIKGAPAEQFVGNIIATLFWMAVYYLFFIYITPSFLLAKKIEIYFGLSVVVLAILPFIGYTILLVSKAAFQNDFSHLYSIYSLQMHISGFKALALAGVYGSFFRLICEYFEKR